MVSGEEARIVSANQPPPENTEEGYPSWHAGFAKTRTNNHMPRRHSPQNFWVAGLECRVVCSETTPATGAGGYDQVVTGTPYVLRWEQGGRLRVDNDWSSGEVWVHTVKLFRSGQDAEDADEIDQESFIDENFGLAATYPLLPFRETEDRLLARNGIARDDVTVEDDDDSLGFD